MKKIIMLLICMFACLTVSAKKPIVDVQSHEINGHIEVVNDSTIIYYNVYGIQVAQHSDVYTGVFEYNANRKKPMKLVTMRAGAYIWEDPDQNLGTYILYASKAFDRVILRAKE